MIGANILPARVLRPTDKQAVERAFSGIQSLLLEILLGWRGIDTPTGAPIPRPTRCSPSPQAEHLIATWIVSVWQNRELGEYAPAWDPGTRHSPNTLFAAAMSQGGFALQIPAPELYYELLPVHLVKIHGRRGVKIRGLWYDGPALDPYRSGPVAPGRRGQGQVEDPPRAPRPALRLLLRPAYPRLAPAALDRAAAGGRGALLQRPARR